MDAVKTHPFVVCRQWTCIRFAAFKQGTLLQKNLMIKHLTVRWHAAEDGTIFFGNRFNLNDWWGNKLYFFEIFTICKLTTVFNYYRNATCCKNQQKYNFLKKYNGNHYELTFTLDEQKLKTTGTKYRYITDVNLYRIVTLAYNQHDQWSILR